MLRRVCATLESAGVAYGLIGGAALAVHGISRSTLDVDLLAVDLECLTPLFWASLSDAGIDVETRRGDATDPLAGVVRFTAAAQTPIDLVVGRAAWQRGALERAGRALVEGIEIPVLLAPDLILLKLYAGGPQDAWDVQQLLESQPSSGALDQVERLLPELPASATLLWREIQDRQQE